MDVNGFRKWSNAIAETVDAWRLVPRLMVVAYGFLTWKTWEWYTGLEAIVTKSNCQLLGSQVVCDITGIVGPSTQQAALVTAVVGAAAVVIGLYSSSGKDWTKPLLPWFGSKNDEKKDDSNESSA
jgi:hypothetical protein